LTESDIHRLIFLFFAERPTRESAMRALDAFSGVQNAYLGTSDDTQRPSGHVDTKPHREAHQRASGARVLRRSHRLATRSRCCCATGSGSPLVQRNHTADTTSAKSGETFSGTIQLCCFERRKGLSDAALEHIWFQEHVQVALDTQNTLGYRQNRVLRSSHDQLDGIVEEHFTIEAANSLTAFFADGDDEAKMMSNIHVLTESSERVLDLERSSVIHMTEHRLR